MNQIVHITDSHSSFDDRIFFKELGSLSKKYDCTQIVISKENNAIYDMGGIKKSPGVYNNIKCFSVSYFLGNSLLSKCFCKILPFIYHRLKYLGVRGKIIKILRKNNIKPVLIHYHDLRISNLSLRISRKLKTKLIFDCHEFFFSFYFDKKLNFLNLVKASKSILKLKKAVKKADFVISVTKNLDGILYLLKKNERHSIIYNSSLIPLNTINKGLSLNEKITLVHEGSLSFDKGFKLMIDMFEDKDIRDNFKLKIVGQLKGKELDYFNSKCKTLNLTDNDVYCTGWVKYEDLADYVKGDIALLFFGETFNNYYGMPNRLFNYHCAGMPVLCTHCGDLSNMIENTRTGIVAERTIQDIKKCLFELKNNYGYYYSNIQHNAYLYHWDNEVEKLLQIYEKVLSC